MSKKLKNSWINKIKDKRSVWDKIVFVLSFITTVVLFIVDKSTHFIYNPETQEGLDLLIGVQVISCLSFFFTVLSFVWDNKFNSLKKGILIGKEEDAEEQSLASLRRELMSDYSNVKKSVAEIIRLVRGSITDTLLSEKENNIWDYFDISDDNSYAIIYIITNSMIVELDGFEEPIRNNILKDVQYVYMTPLTDEQFDVSMRDKIIGNIKNDHWLNAAYKKNIHHISNPDFFKGLPAYSDMAIYTKRQYIHRGADGDKNEGYYCFQNGALEEHIDGDVGTKKVYYYQQMDNSLITKLIELIKEHNFWDSACSSYLSVKTEKKPSSITGLDGLFVKENEHIKRGEEIFVMGGYFLSSAEIASETDPSNTFLQIKDDMYLGGINTEREKCAFPANHACEANCELSGEITFVATRDIEAGEEILVDYWRLGKNYNKPFVCVHTGCSEYETCKHDLSSSSIHKREKTKTSLPFLCRSKGE